MNLGDGSGGLVVIAHDQPVSLEQAVAVATGAPVLLDERTARLLDARRAEAVSHVTGTCEPAYGFNRGFGHNVDVPVPAEQLERLQLNLVRSHACGVGPPAPPEVVRAAMFLRAASLARGHSGVRARVVEALVDFLNAGITPAVPAIGSVGASGDLAPLAHIALSLIGEGQASAPDGAVVPAGQALAGAGLAPLRLEMKEGLALTNGVQFSCAYGVLACSRLSILLGTAAVSTALSCQVLLGSDAPFAEDVQRLRPHPGAIRVAGRLRALMASSPIRAFHSANAVDWEVQDPYSLRCAAQILGACHDLLDDAERALRIEANSVTDNPLIMADEAGRFTRIVSAGHFHGMPVAVRLYGLLQAAAIVATLANLRCARFVDEDRNRGLGADLIWPHLASEERSASSGMMIPEYVSAALTNSLWGLLVPSHVFSVPTDAGQEDHVSMSAGLAVRLWEALDRVAETLAVELAFGSQAAAIRAAAPAMVTKRGLPSSARRATEASRAAYVAEVERAIGEHGVHVHAEVRQSVAWPEADRRLSPACEAVVALVREEMPVVTEDRSLSAGLRALARRVAAGDVLAAAQAEVPLTESGNG